MSSLDERLERAFVDRYRVSRELGRGGMATVYLAEDLKHGRDVAIKVLLPDVVTSMGADRFEREIRLAAGLTHPHIVGLHDSGAAEGLLYYVMPFVNGESLRARLARERQLPIDDALRIAAEVCDALTYAHGRGIIHRDIKPENIMLSDGHALVADFGIAQALSAGGAEKLTLTGTSVGTPLYMSPEQAAGETVGATADIYSLACVVYEMLSGAPPFTGATPRAIMARHAMEPAPSLRIVRDTIPEEIEDAILTALNKVPADRPQTAAEFAALLGVPGRSASSQPAARLSSARRVTAPIRTRRHTTLPRWRQPRTLGVGLLIGLGVALAAWRLMAARTTELARVAAVDGVPRNRIAVLYFDDLSAKRSLDFLASGVTDGLISVLGAVPGLQVISRGGVAPYRGGTVSRDSIARALRVGSIISGSVEPEADSIRVTVRLFDDAGIELNRATFKKPQSDLATLSDSLASEVATLMRKRLGEEVRVGRERAGTRNTDAWSLYQRAVLARARGDSLALAGDSSWTTAYRVADSVAGLAEALDGKWTSPTLLRGWLDLWRSRRAQDSTSLRRFVDSGYVHAEQALDVDHSSADALELRGTLRYWSWLAQPEPDSSRREQTLSRARADLERAVQVNPAQAGAWASLSHMYNNVAEKTNADVVFAAMKAMEADAYLANASVVMWRLALAAYDDARFGEMDKWCREGRRRFPKDRRFVECQLWLMTADYAPPDPHRATVLADTLVQLSGDDLERRYSRLHGQAIVAAVLVRAGNRDSARALLLVLRPDPVLDPSRDFSHTASFVWVLLGDNARAIEELKRYVAANPARRADFTHTTHWWYRELVKDPRYEAAFGAAR